MRLIPKPQEATDLLQESEMVFVTQLKRPIRQFDMQKLSTINHTRR